MNPIPPLLNESSNSKETQHKKSLRIGFVGTRFAGTDGVSLEIQKWLEVLESEGHICFFFAGLSDFPAEPPYLVDEADFTTLAIATLNQELFESHGRSSSISAAANRLKTHLKNQLEGFAVDFRIDLLIVENALSLPMNVPLGLALTEYLVEHQTPTIAKASGSSASTISSTTELCARPAMHCTVGPAWTRWWHTIMNYA